MSTLDFLSTETIESAEVIFRELDQMIGITNVTSIPFLPSPLIPSPLPLSPHPLSLTRSILL